MKNNIIKISYLFVLYILFMAACGQEKLKGSKEIVLTYPSNGLLSPKEFQKIVTSEFQIIDVRTPAEYDSGHIKNAVNINFYDNDFVTRLAQLDKSKPIVVYCGVGGRSGKTFDQIRDLGFASFFDLEGGIKAWKAAELPLEL